MKYLTIALIMFISACSNEEIPEPSPSITISQSRFILAGQSNAEWCQWYFQNVDSVAISGRNIKQLIAETDYDAIDGEYDGIAFIHGETDSIEKTDLNQYIADVELYRNMLSDQAGRDLTLYISSVGYYTHETKSQFDDLRAAVELEAEINEKWSVFYQDAHTFGDRGMLRDEIHFNAQGCKEIYAALANNK